MSPGFRERSCLKGIGEQYQGLLASVRMRAGCRGGAYAHALHIRRALLFLVCGLAVFSCVVLMVSLELLMQVQSTNRVTGSKEARMR